VVQRPTRSRTGATRRVVVGGPASPLVGRVLQPSFYDRPTELVARELLGAILEHQSPDGIASGRIVETEAYLGPDDPACHAVAGRTERTWHLHGPPGVAYIYFIYGAHWCFNAVTREEGHGSAVLVRAVEPVRGIDLMRKRRPSARRDSDLTNGPGKLCAALGIDGGLDGSRLDRGPLKILQGEPIEEPDVEVTSRIGITRAADWPLRWLVRGNPYVSLGRPGVVKPRRRTRR
jgi:DNA-3-methyladenine glycosylase